MEQLSVLDKTRNVLSKILQHSQLIIRYVLKFLLFFAAFRMISGMEIFSPYASAVLNSTMVQLVLAAVCMLLPNRSGVLAALIILVYNVFQSSLIGSVIVGLIMLLLYIASANLFPDQTFLLLLVPIFIHFNWYLAIPLFAGMYLGLGSAVPVVLGVMAYGVLDIIPLFMDLQMGSSIDQLPQLITSASSSGLSQLTHNDSMIFLIVLSGLVVLCVGLLRKLHVRYNRYISLGTGSMLGLILLIVGINKGKVVGSAGSILLWAVLAIAVLFALEVLHVSLNYKGARNLEFEDDDYVYQVRMIPKINAKKPDQEDYSHIIDEDIEKEIQEQKNSRRKQERPVRREAAKESVSRTRASRRVPVPQETIRLDPSARRAAEEKAKASMEQPASAGAKAGANAGAKAGASAGTKAGANAGERPSESGSLPSHKTASEAPMEAEAAGKASQTDMNEEKTQVVPTVRKKPQPRRNRQDLSFGPDGQEDQEEAVDLFEEKIR